MNIDVAINALGRPFQTTLCIRTLLAYNRHSIGKIYLTIDAETSTSEKEKFLSLLAKIDFDISIYCPQVSHGYFDNITGPFDDYEYRMGIRYQHAWENSDADFLFVAHNDCFFTGPLVPRLHEAISDNIIIGQLGVCWNCPAQWENRCSRGGYKAYSPSFDQLMDLYTKASPPASVKFDYRYHESQFNEKWREQPWPLPACRVNEWACLINLKKAREITMPLGSAVPFGATTYIGSRLVDTSCEWFHDVIGQGHTASDFPVEDYIIHAHGISQAFSAQEYELNEIKALKELVKKGFM